MYRHTQHAYRGKLLCKYALINWFELSPESSQEVNLHCEHSQILSICPTMKIANFWLERDYLTVKVSSKGAFKDKNNGTKNFKIGSSMVKL